MAETTTTTTEPLDLLHRVLNWVSYNRYFVFALVLAAVLMPLASCQIKATNPITGEQATADQIEADVQVAAKARQLAQAKAEHDTKAAIAAIQAKAVADIDAKTAEIALGTQERLDFVDSLNAKASLAYADIDRKSELVKGGLDFVQSTIGALNPAIGSTLAVAFGLIAGGLKLDNSRKDRKIAALATGTTA